MGSNSQIAGIADSQNPTEAPLLGAGLGHLTALAVGVWLPGVIRLEGVARLIEELVLPRGSIGLMVYGYPLHRLRNFALARRVPAVFGRFWPAGWLLARGSEENHRSRSQFLEHRASR